MTRKRLPSLPASGGAFVRGDADVGNFARFFERDMKPLVAFQPMECHVIGRTEGGEVRSFFR